MQRINFSTPNDENRLLYGHWPCRLPAWKHKWWWGRRNGNLSVWVLCSSFWIPLFQQELLYLNSMNFESVTLRQISRGIPKKSLRFPGFLARFEHWWRCFQFSVGYGWYLNPAWGFQFFQDHRQSSWMGRIHQKLRGNDPVYGGSWSRIILPEIHPGSIFQIEHGHHKPELPIPRRDMPGKEGPHRARNNGWSDLSLFH